MSPERQILLNVRRLPAFVDRIEAAILLGREPHEVAILERAGLIKACGHPPKSGKRMYSSAAIMKLASGEDPKLLDKMADAIYRHWQKANQDKLPSNGGEGKNN